MRAVGDVRSPSRSSGLFGRLVVLRLLVVFSLTVALVPAMSGVASAAASLTATPITWGVIGLDGNDVTAGPNTFASGARVCDTGSSAATNVTATYLWTSANANINLAGQNPLSVSTLAAGACYDFYFNVVITRIAAAYNTARNFRIDVTADTLGTVSTPTPRQVYVDKLISQNRNQVDSVTGPTSVVVGSTYTYVLTAHTAPGGYEQLSSFLNLSNSVFQIISVATTYTAPAGGTNSTIYGDACGWQPDPSLVNYLSCVGPLNYAGGKVGGTVVTTYQVKILATGSNMSVYGLIYDHSGGSYHYNSDYGTGGAGITNITASEAVDLSLTKTDSADPITAGTDLTYTMVAANAGPSTAHSVSITDPIPAGTTFVSADSGGTRSVGTVTWNLGDVTSGSSSTVHLTVHVNASRTAGLSNTATVATTTTDTNSANDSATQTTAVATSANLSLTKSDAPDPVGVGQNLTYTLSVANAGPSDALGVSVSDTLPGGVTFVSATPTQGSCSQAAGVITCPLGTVANGGTPSVTVVVRPTAAGSITNTASVSSSTSDPANGNNSDSAGTTVQPSADLSVTKGDSPDPVTAGNQVTYTMVVTNNGPSTATSTVLTDPLPAGASFVSADGGGTQSGGTVTWNLGSLVNGASITVHLVVAVNAGRTAALSNTASVSSSITDPDSSNNSATQGTTVATSADLSITKSDSPDPVVIGQNVTYTLSVGNAGPSDALAVSVTDGLPAGLTYVSATPSQGSCSQAAGTVSCSLGTVAPAATPIISIVATSTGSGTVTNSASVSSSTSDPSIANNSDSEDTTISPRADLSIVKTDSPDPVSAGNDETYTLTVHNAGPSTASAVVVSDTVPAGTTYVFATPSVGTCGQAAGVVTCSLGAMANNTTETVTLVVHVASSRTSGISNTASVVSSTTDPNSANDSSTQATTVQVRADVGVTATDSADPVAAGTDLTYTFVVTNNGPSDATGVVLTDPVAAGTTFVSADGGGSESGGTVTWNVGSMTAGTSQTFHLTVHVDPARTLPLTTTAAVTSTTTDANAANDAATEPTTVAVSGDLSVTKTDASATVTAGGSAIYMISLTNVGASIVPAGAVVTDTIPAGTTGSEGEADCAIVGGALTCTTSSSLAPGNSVSWQLTLDVSSGYGPATLANTAAVTSSPVADTNSANDSATDTDTIVRATDLSITKSDSVDPVVAGTDLTYTLTVANAGPSDASGVLVTDPLPVGATFVSADGGGSESAGIVTWNVGALAASGSVPLHVTVHVDASRTAGLSNTADVTGNEPDSNGVNDSATEATAVATSADLSITKTDGVDPVAAGTDLTYTIVVGNNGPSDATGVTVTDPVPAGTLFVSADGGGSESGGTVTWNVGTVAAAASATMHVTVHVNPGRTTGLSNTASVSANEADPDVTNNDATQTTAVDTATDLSITKTDSADPVTAGTDLTYALVVTNNGPSHATGVSVSDPLPAGTTFVSADNGGTESGGTVAWNVGALANGATFTLHVTVHVNSARAAGLSNTASVTGNEPDPDGANNDATETTAVGTSADLSITKTDSADPIVAGTDLTYTLVVTNNGPSDATGVIVSDPVPAGTAFVSADGAGAESGGTVTWNVGALANGASTTVHVTVNVDPGRITDLSNTASVTASTSDPDGSNDDATQTTGVTPLTALADLSITKTDSADPVIAGTDLTYTLVATNIGPADATGVIVTDPLPVGTSFVWADGGGIGSGGTVTWNLGGLANGATAMLHVTVHVDSGRTTALSNTATVAGNQTDTDPTNDSATETTAVSTSADLQITKTDSADPATAGTDLTYTLTVTNNGPSNATGVVVTDPLPAGTSFAAADGGGAEASGIVTWNLGTLANGAVTTLHVTVTIHADRTADLSNSASVAATTSDPDVSNNDATETTAIDTSSDLSITKTDGADPVTAGTDLTYTLGVTNNGPSDAAGVTVTDPLPAGVTFVSADNGGVESGGTVTWSVGALANGATTDLHVTVSLDAGLSTDLSNTATVTASTPDPDGSNDSATQVTTVVPVSASSDLSITKTDSADPATAGTDLTYTLTATNNGPANATGVTITDPLPAGVSFVSADTGGTESAGTVTWDVGALANGATAIVTVTVHIDSSLTADLSNTASVAGDQADPDTSNDSVIETTAVIASADLHLTKTAAASSSLGSDLLYTITVTNDGPSDATGVVVTDPLPAGAAFVSATPTIGSCTQDLGILTCDLGALGNGAVATIALTVTPTTLGDLVNTASVTSDVADPGSANDSDTATTTIVASVASADLSITKTGTPDPVTVGGNVTYTITVTNQGPDAADAVIVTDPLDARLSFVSADQGGTESAGVVTWDLGQLSNGASRVLTVIATVESDHTLLVNTATVTSSTPDPNLANDQASATIDPIDPSAVDTDLSVKKTVDSTHPSAGDTLTYAIVAHNGGPGDATGVKISDHLPAGLTYVSSKADVGDYNDATGIWQVGGLAAGTSATLHIKAMLTSSKVGSSIDNTARLAGLNEQDTNTKNNAGTQNIIVTDVSGAGGSGGGPGGTAFTGAHIARALAAMLFLLVAGALLLIAGRRREREDLA